MGHDPIGEVSSRFQQCEASLDGGPVRHHIFCVEQRPDGRRYIFFRERGSLSKNPDQLTQGGQMFRLSLRLSLAKPWTQRASAQPVLQTISSRERRSQPAPMTFSPSKKSSGGSHGYDG